MTYHQRVDLRVNFGGRIQFATDEGRRDYEDLCLAARARQKVRYAVAPRMTIGSPRGTLREGDEVTLSDFEGLTVSAHSHYGNCYQQAVDPSRALEAAIADGRVLEAEQPSP